MKYETLLKRYKSLGYDIIGYEDRDMEIQSIVKWLYAEKKIFVSVQYYTHGFGLLPSPENKFGGCYRRDCGQYHSMMFSPEKGKYFDDPGDAYYDTLRLMVPTLFFRKNYGDW